MRAAHQLICQHEHRLERELSIACKQQHWRHGAQQLLLPPRACMHCQPAPALHVSALPQATASSNIKASAPSPLSQKLKRSCGCKHTWQHAGGSAACVQQRCATPWLHRRVVRFQSRFPAHSGLALCAELHACMPACYSTHLQTWPQQVNDHHVVVSFHAIPPHVGDSNCMHGDADC